MNVTTSSDSTGASTPGRERALVLHGGGSSGNAWEIGVVAGLAEGGVDVAGADLVVGTSAGSTAAVQITSASLTDLLAEILGAPPTRPGTAPSGPAGASARPVVDHLARTDAIIAASSDAADMRRRMGAAALELDEGPQHSERWRAIVAARLPVEDWPDRRILITAVDARTGEGVAFDRHSGIDLVDAVAASTSSGAPYRVGDDRYIDGGYRRNENADLATGFARVLVLSPFGGRSRHPDAWGMQLAAQVEELRAGCSRVATVFPDPDAAHLFGANAMDPANRPPAARVGREQGLALAERLREFWS
ncbi:MAG TPA: patatin-like phospholipase family protein [Amnibacterium sp.]|jgi:NTE family protein|uniref:patatin-like phospholipase family protein n=1 Tax=Amnibacterium sp. TaxID=1872496 RepID=UPI002F95BA5C